MMQQRRTSHVFLRVLLTISLTKHVYSAESTPNCKPTIDNSEQIVRDLIQNEVEWIFGYGSLIWNPGFEVDDSVPGYITGYKRRFWLANESHRGTSEYPGRVLDLYEPDESENSEDFNVFGDSSVSIDSSIVHGVAFKIKSTQKFETYKKLAFRERAGYQIKIQDFRSLTGADFSVALFLGENGCKLSRKGESLEETAEIISTAVGPSGSNLEYFENFVNDLVRKKLPVDNYLQKLGELVEEKKLKSIGSCEDFSCHDYSVLDRECMEP